MKNDNTTLLSLPFDREDEIREALELTFEAFNEKGYNPISQIVGYIMSGDPIYITSHKGARIALSKIEREEILEVVFKDFIEK